MAHKIKIILSLLALAIILALPFVLRPYAVLGSSMYPTLKNNEVVLVDTLSLYALAPQRGELIVFRNPHRKLEGDNVEVDIKRVIGLPGETVHVRPDSVVINDTVYASTTLLGGGGSTPSTSSGRSGSEEPSGSMRSPSGNGIVFDMYLGPHDYFVLGDNRRDSSDSRYFGAVQAENFVGRAALRVLPLPRIGIL